MEHSKTLNLNYNQSWGLFPALLSVLLSNFVTSETALFTGTGIGILLSLLLSYHPKNRPAPLLLYYSTLMMILLSVAHLLYIYICPPQLVDLVVEISIIFPLIILLSFRNKIRGVVEKISDTARKYRELTGIESTLVTARIFLILVGIQVILSALMDVFVASADWFSPSIIYNILPALTLLLTFAINQWCIHYFNKLIQRHHFLPIVNKKGDVLGKCLAEDSKVSYIHPIIRIGVIVGGKIFLHSQTRKTHNENNAIDVFIEGNLYWGETVSEGAKRLLRQRISRYPLGKLHFHLFYYLEMQQEKKLVYLYTLDLSQNKELLSEPCFEKGYLWSLNEIKHNLYTQYFSENFEYEYRLLKEIVQTRKNYKGNNILYL